MKLLSLLFKTLLVLALLVVLAFAGMSIWSRIFPPELGLVDGRLRPCPDRPNCVNSMDPAADKQIEPLAYVGDRAQTEAALRSAMTRIELVGVQQLGDYWQQTHTSLIFRFIDDIEVLFDDQNRVIHIRSASRVGYSDRGVNRARVEALREALRTAAG